MNPLKRTESINTDSGDYTLKRTKKRPHAFSDERTLPPALRDSQNSEKEISSPIDGITTTVAKRIITKSNTHQPPVNTKLTNPQLRSFKSEPNEETIGIKEDKKNKDAKLIQEMIANSTRAFEEHREKENSYKSTVFAPANPPTANSLPPVTVKAFIAERQGIRSTMEDGSFFKETSSGYIAGIFDGHGGDGVAKMASKEFPRAFVKAFKKTENPHTALNDTIRKIHEKAVTQQNLKFVGSACAVSFISKSGTIYTATVGDCEAFRYQKNDTGEITSTPLSVVRDWSTASEGIRAAKLANTEDERINRLNGINDPNPKRLRVKNATGERALNLSNAIGDITYNAVRSDPIITIDQIQEKKAILGIFCDGVTDFVSQPEIIRLMKEHRPDDLVDKILDHAIITKGSTDNGTGMILYIKRESET